MHTVYTVYCVPSVFLYTWYCFLFLMHWLAWTLLVCFKTSNEWCGVYRKVDGLMIMQACSCSRSTFLLVFFVCLFVYVYCLLVWYQCKRALHVRPINLSTTNLIFCQRSIDQICPPRDLISCQCHTAAAPISNSKVVHSTECLETASFICISTCIGKHLTR